jgi:hypothetical protein
MEVLRAAGGMSVMFLLSKITSPCVMCSWPAIIRNNEVFPQPEGPNKQQYWLVGNDKLTPRTARVSP